MPLYEYRSVEDGQTITLLRSMSDADKPAHDPAGKGRTFLRVHSTFSTGGAAAAGKPSGAGHVHHGGCGCGNPHGPCGM